MCKGRCMGMKSSPCICSPHAWYGVVLGSESSPRVWVVQTDKNVQAKELEAAGGLLGSVPPLPRAEVSHRGTRAGSSREQGREKCYVHLPCACRHCQHLGHPSLGAQCGAWCPGQPQTSLCVRVRAPKDTAEVFPSLLSSCWRAAPQNPAAPSSLSASLTIYFSAPSQRAVLHKTSLLYQ